MIRQHCTVGALALLAVQAAAAPAALAQELEPTSRFIVFLAGRQLGSEQSSVTGSADGWVVRGSGRLGQPVDRTTSAFEAKYDRDWRPLSAEVRAVVRNAPTITRTTFAGGDATSDTTAAGESSRKVDRVSDRPIILPPGTFFAAFEALALRLRTMTVPADVRAYMLAQGELPIRVAARTAERIRTPDRAMAATRFDLVMSEPGGAVQAELWVDEESRLLRFRLPAQGIEMAREDMAAVSARVERMGRPNDEEVRMAAAGFTLVGTLSKPSSEPGSEPARRPKTPGLPAVVLVPSAAAADRDQTLSGVSLFAQLANSLADAGFAVVRYDRRGLGQSGGREESATVGDYADDARAVVAFLRKRRDVDQRRVALVGHGEGGFIAMQAAADAKDAVSALVLLATPGTTGSDFVIEQQLRLLEQMGLPAAERQARIELQERLHHAAISGQGWDTVPPAYRLQADTGWFRSQLVFDPVKVMEKVRQPVLVMSGERDESVPARHAKLLADAARARKKSPGAELVVVEGVGHLLAPEAREEAGAPASPADTVLSPKVSGGLVAWLKDILHVVTSGAGH